MLICFFLNLVIVDSPLYPHFRLSRIFAWGLPPLPIMGFHLMCAERCLLLCVLVAGYVSIRLSSLSMTVPSRL